MFISYKFIKSSWEKHKYSWEFELTDSEFGTISGVDEMNEEHAAFALAIGFSIIKEYSKRNLNVAANLAAAFALHQKEYPYLLIQDMVDHNKKYNPLFPQHEENLQKYLLLL
jgi:hypothetical protein